MSKLFSLALVAAHLDVLALCRTPNQDRNGGRLGLSLLQQNRSEDEVPTLPTYNLETLMEFLCPDITYLQFSRLLRSGYDEMDEVEHMVTLENIEAAMTRMNLCIPEFHQGEGLTFEEFCKRLETEFQSQPGFAMNDDTVWLPTDTREAYRSFANILPECRWQNYTFSCLFQGFGTVAHRPELKGVTVKRFDLLTFYFMVMQKTQQLMPSLCSA